MRCNYLRMRIFCLADTNDGLPIGSSLYRSKLGGNTEEKMQNTGYQAVCELVLGELHASLYAIRAEEVERLLEAVHKAQRVFFIGVGRTLFSLQAIAKRWAHLGIDAHIVGEVTEPAITAEDILIAGSGGGNTMLPVGIAKKAKAIGAMVAYIGSNPDSPLRDSADFMVRIPVRTRFELEDEIVSRQPMASLFEQSLLLLGDIVAKMLIDRQGLDMAGLWQYHANLE